MQRIYALLLSMLLVNGASAEGKITICSDSNFWYPFTFVSEGQSAGLHIDIITKALSNLGYQPEFKPLPWKRCLADAKQGSVNGVATASYKESRAEFLYYPDDAPTSQKSAQRVMQVEYIVVTSADSSYEFDGDVKTIPTPIRAPRGYSIADDLRNKGVAVDDNAPGDENNLKKLLRYGDGAVVIIPEVVKALAEKAEYKGKLKVSEMPLKSKSYYLAISKEASMAAEARERIWAEIAKVRDDEAFIATAAAKY